MNDRNQCQGPDIDEIYKQLCENQRFSDEISFKLLGFVPLVTGAAYLGLLFKEDIITSTGIFYISILGAAITLALFCWELRNIKTCNFLIDEISKLELRRCPELKRKYGNTPPCLVFSFSKTRAVKAVYALNALAWMSMPLTLGKLSLSEAWRYIFASYSGNLTIWASVSAFLSIILVLCVRVSCDTTTNSSNKCSGEDLDSGIKPSADGDDSE